MSDQPKPKRGRPPGTTKPPGERKTQQIKLACTPADLRLYEQLENGPELLRQAIRKEAKKARV